jgi:phosphoribosylformylglycinamidine synthase II/phosphoribosylformylglycinamidine synthase I
MTIHRVEVFPTPNEPDPQGHGRLQAAHQLGYDQLQSCRAGRLYFLQGDLTPVQLEQIGQELLADPVTEQYAVDSNQYAVDSDQWSVVVGRWSLVEATLLPGVTDPAAENLVRAAHLLGIDGLEQAATGQIYWLEGALTAVEAEKLATAVLVNPVVQRFSLNQAITAPFVAPQKGSFVDAQKGSFVAPQKGSFAAAQQADDRVETIPLRPADDDQLQAISGERRLALNLAEMQAIRAYYQAEQRDPTDVELEMLAQTWSEHCVHKTFRATIHYTGPLPGQPAGSEPVAQEIPGLLKSYIRAATEQVNKPWVRSAFVDNAGIIAFDDQFDLAFKVETHNHPSALEPFGGANTGVGGVVRDVLGVSARPIANTDILCFGPPDLPADQLPAGTLHPRRIADGVTHGIEDYGNKMGIPTVNGAILYHPGYTANPLVYCGCLGLLPHGSHPTAAQPGDLIIAIGGRTGRDGLRGATFSSMEMDQTTSEIAGSAVQIGDPIQEKRVQEVVLRARDEWLYTAVTDCGAGGFSSAVGEMGEQLGAHVQLADAPLKYPGLRPWEIWLSEAQERMVLAVPPDNWPRLQAICTGQDVEAVCLGHFTGDGRIRIYHHDQLVGELSMDFLHNGLPKREMRAEWKVDSEKYSVNSEQSSVVSRQSSVGALLLQLLAHPNIRSKEDVVRKYDHEVQGGTAVKPLTGVDNHGPSDAAVLVPLDSQLATADRRPPTADSLAVGRPRSAVALSNGICPQYGELDPYFMAWAAVDEAFRNVTAVGADPDYVAILDNFCWGNPNLPDRLGGLVRCAQGCYDAAVAYNTPYISGKDSLNNEYTGADGQKHAIPGTILISALARVPDVAKTVTMDWKRPGSFLFMAGDTRGEMGGSHAVMVGGQGQMPDIDMGVPQPIREPLPRFRALYQAIQAGLVLSCHDCSEGGIGVALAEMALAGRVGARVELMHAPRGYHADYIRDEVALFSESLGRFVVEVAPDKADAFREIMRDAAVPHNCFGVVGGERLVVNGRTGEPILDLAVTELEEAWRGQVKSEKLEVKSEKSEVKSSPLTSHFPLPTSHAALPKILILHANGTNRDREAALACEWAGGMPEIVHVNQLLSGERRLADYQMLILPGGFSYGDDLGAGKLWALDLRHRFGQDVRQFVADGRPVLGICNGFQALVKAGILPGGSLPGQFPIPNYHLPLTNAQLPATLTFNNSGHFECRWAYLKVNSHSQCVFTQGINDLIYCPVAHGEGRLATADAATAEALATQGLIALTYANPDGAEVGYPANPNGSVLQIAGLTNAAGNVLGLMPHPEDHIFPWQHPRAHRGEAGRLGLHLFVNGVKNC